MPSDSVAQVPDITPHFFGPPERRLFGVYHAPAGTSVRDAGVVLCYPGPQEYSQVHWAFQKLAGMLAAAGFHVLRFDYSATGDSSGESAHASMVHWTEDIATAASGLRELAAIRRISLVGMRLGGALALRAAAASEVRDLVLWDAVITGSSYVQAIEEVERLRVRALSYPEPNTPVPGEIMGYPFGGALRTATLSIDLLAEPLPSVGRILLVAPAATDAQVAFQQSALAAGLDVTVRTIDDPSLYATGRHPSDALLAHNIPVAITSFLARTDG